MPVLWQPGVATTNIAFSLNIVATQYIGSGVALTFSVYDGLRMTYEEALATVVTLSPKYFSFSLTLTRAVPPGTVLVVSMTSTTTAIWGYTGTTQYTATGLGLPAQAFLTVAPLTTLLCFASVPSTSNPDAPVVSQPMFAIGYNYMPDPPPVGSLQGCIISGASNSAPNFPDQWSAGLASWVFLYTVVYPAVVKVGNVCSLVVGIKFLEGPPAYCFGSWTGLRGLITQPYTVVEDNFQSVSRWAPYASTNGVFGYTSVTDVGPFVLALMEGQLTVVYFRPLPKVQGTQSTPVSNIYSELALLVTAPIAPHTYVFFTINQYDSTNNSFGTIDDGVFTPAASPTFQWVTGSTTILAGTVVLFTGIGSLTVAVVDAHGVADVGSINANFSNGLAVVSIMAMATWSSPPTNFITAAISNQYAGDVPVLSPCLTMNNNLFFGPMIYGQGLVFDNDGLPGTVQASVINSSLFKLIPDAEAVVPTSLPAFVNMATFHF